MTETITLSDSQTVKAEQLLEMLDEDIHPSDIVSEWNPTPSRTNLEWTNIGGEYIPVTEIIGTEKHNIDRLEPKRMKNIVELLLNGEFNREHHLAPVLCKIDGDYYVDSDGNHRVLAHKFIGIEEIYADVVVYREEF